MKLRNVIRFGLTAALLAGTFALNAPRATAQGFGGGGQMPPEIKKKIEAWQKWRDQHKNTSSLSTLIYQIGEMNKSAGYELTKPQAGKVLGIINKWKTKPQLSEDEAKTVTKQINGTLTTKQIKKLSTIQPQFGRGGGGRPGGGGPGGGRPGGGGPGGGRPGGGFQFPDPPKGGFNPLNPDTLPMPQMKDMAKQRMNAFMGDLEKRSH